MVGQRAHRDGRPEVALTPRESDVLAHLLRACPGLASGAELLLDVSGPDHDGDANIVDVYIGHLRRKLASAGEVVGIDNVRGFGFKVTWDS